ncbi:MAG: terminase small subunit [Ruminococcus sp.]|uniref:terminase small subunit n=1 Tax=Ruminococcus sp. TaxID=41978 RepID=UPI0025F629AF|nr:terminase small subunit [Ruminococcus sp.]MBR0529388.1 terminase small subunit [Ruminococcus sp.]
MTARQRKFAEYYAECGNATQSAIKAGYSEKYAHTNASKLLNVDEVKEYIRELTEKGQRERIMSALERQALLSDIIRDKGETIGARLRAVEILNKMTGSYITDDDSEDIYKKLDSVLSSILSEP